VVSPGSVFVEVTILVQVAVISLAVVVVQLEVVVSHLVQKMEVVLAP
jgi:hypothetical protein